MNQTLTLEQTLKVAERYRRDMSNKTNKNWKINNPFTTYFKTNYDDKLRRQIREELEREIEHDQNKLNVPAEIDTSVNLLEPNPIYNSLQYYVNNNQLFAKSNSEPVMTIPIISSYDYNWNSNSSNATFAHSNNGFEFELEANSEPDIEDVKFD